MSAGYEDGNYCIIEVNGVDLAVNKRGHNVVVINPVTKEMISKRFDTWDASANGVRSSIYLLQINSSTNF